MKNRLLSALKLSGLLEGGVARVIKQVFPSYDRVGGLIPVAEHLTLHLAFCMAVYESLIM